MTEVFQGSFYRKPMQKRLWILMAVMLGLAAVVGTGCQRAKATGKLQIMFSGNIRGNVAPCG
jgi:hypothetical protein